MPISRTNTKYALLDWIAHSSNLRIGGKELKDFEIVISDSEIEISDLIDLPHGVYILKLSARNRVEIVKLVH